MSLLIFRPLLLNQRYKLIKPFQQLNIYRRIELRQFATEKSNSNKNAVSINNTKYEVSSDVKPLGERIKENTKTVSYMSIIVLGLTVTGIMFIAIFRELLSSSSSNNVYSAALERCVNDPRIQDSLGSPIKGYGEETRRRRRQHVAHTKFERNGIPHMRMKFYIQGIRNKATVHLEMRQNSAGNFDYRYLFVQLDHYPRTTIILEDDRANDNISGNNLLSLTDDDDSNSFKL